MNKLLFLLALILPVIVNGQYAKNLVSDRPGQSMSPNTVGKKALQFQFGYTYSKYDETTTQLHSLFGEESNLSDEKENSLNLVTRYGLGERTEFSIDLNLGKSNSKYNQVSSSAENSFESESDENNYQLGIALRQNLINNVDAGFHLGAQLRFAYGESSLKQSISAVSIVLAASKQLSDKFSLTGNVASNSLSSVDFFFTCNLGYSLTDRLGIFAEYYPTFANSSNGTTEKNLKMSESFVNTGLSFMISPNFLLDLSGGFLVSDDEREDNVDISEYNIQIGLTSRLDWR